MDRHAVQRWIDAYELAWRTPGTGALAQLFAARASYQTAPFERPHEGLAAISDMWEAERDGPGEVFSITSELVAVEGDTAVARVEVAYGDPVTERYRDLWIMRFDENGRCASFEEWPFWPPGATGQVAAAPRGRHDVDSERPGP